MIRATCGILQRNVIGVLGIVARLEAGYTMKKRWEWALSDILLAVGVGNGGRGPGNRELRGRNRRSRGLRCVACVPLEW